MMRKSDSYLQPSTHASCNASLDPPTSGGLHTITPNNTSQDRLDVARHPEFNLEDYWPPMDIEDVIDYVDFWFFSVLIIGFASFAISLFVFTTAELGIVPLMALQLIDRVFQIDLNIPTLAPSVGAFSAFGFSYILLQDLHYCAFPILFANEVKQTHSIFHRKRRPMKEIAESTAYFAGYAFFSDFIAKAIVQENTGLGGLQALEGLIDGARWAVGVSLIAGTALATYHWINAKRRMVVLPKVST